MSPSHSARDNCGFLVLLKSNFSLPRCFHTDLTNRYLDSAIKWTNYNQPDILKIHSQQKASFDKHWSPFWCVWKDISEVSLEPNWPINKTGKAKICLTCKLWKVRYHKMQNAKDVFGHPAFVSLFCAHLCPFAPLDWSLLVTVRFYSKGCRRGRLAFLAPALILVPV